MIGTADPGRHTGTRRQDRPAVVICTHAWEDYLTLGVTEIRQYGAPGIQVMRALRAMLEELREDGRPECRAAVEEELARLDSTSPRNGVTRSISTATVADDRGIGGPGLAEKVSR